MTEHHKNLCETRIAYADIFDRKWGIVDPKILPNSHTGEPPRKRLAPPQGKKTQGKKRPPKVIPPKGLGDTVESALTSVGITSEKVEKWLGRPCNCHGRKQKLNQIGNWAKRILKGNTDEAENELDIIIGQQEKLNPSKPAKKWSYGITTVESRIDNVFTQTLESLKEAGFDNPRLFVDGVKDGSAYEKFGLDITTRYPNIRTAGNWVLTLYELYLRDPVCNYYAVFQDDFVTYKNLKCYLEQCEYPEKGYWNLYTFPSNQSIAPEDHTGWYESNQLGKGAVALVFNREAVATLLGTQHMAVRPQDVNRGWKAIDGGIVSAFKKEGWKEYVHNPSLVQHIGDISTMRNKRHPKAASFKGETFDALNLV